MKQLEPEYDFSAMSEEFYLDFMRCQRPDGTYYGTSGTCRQGTQVGPREMKMLAKAAKAGNKRAGEALKKVAGSSASSPKQPKQSVEDELRSKFKEAKKELGEGSYGAVKETAEGNVIKKGYIGKDEIEIQQKLADVDGVPKVINHAYTSQPFADRGGDRTGFVEMEKARGADLMSQQNKLDNPAVKGRNATKIQNEYIRLRKDLHTRGVAHGDMHEGNVTWDGKKMGVIDFGLSKNSYKSALNEALGSFSSDPRSAFFFDGVRRDGANTSKANKLERRIEQIRRKAGGAITEKRAQQLITELYDGF